jgi:uncharacterized membrane protein
VSNGIETTLVVVGLVAAAVNGGAFFAFSNFVMPALSKLPSSDGVSAMQAINVAAPNPLFVATIVGAGVVGIPVVAAEFGAISEGPMRFLVGGVALSLVSLAVTLGLNVPKNNALDSLDANTTPAADYWNRYLTSWTRANTIRTITSLASAASYALWLKS